MKTVMVTKVKIFSIDGSESGREMELTPHFSEIIRPDLVLRAHTALMKNCMQPHGTNLRAGQRSSAKYMGTRKGWGHSYSYGQARIPRLMIRGGRRVGRAKLVPQAVGGRKAHPPEAISIPGERINNKERIAAIRSGIAATANRDLIVARGHRVTDVVQVPLIVESGFADISKSKAAKECLEKLGCGADLVRTSRKVGRPGRGKMRGRPYKTHKSVLIVVGTSGAKVEKAVRNILGVNVVKVDQLNAVTLAPGGVPGRLTIWTENAITQLKELYSLN